MHAAAAIMFRSFALALFGSWAKKKKNTREEEEEEERKELN
jgi:hypothetical protein